MTATVNRELQILCDLELSILRDGAIKADCDGYFTSREDRPRTNAIEALMDKYTCGWYIAERPSVKEQILDINRFKGYILAHDV